MILVTGATGHIGRSIVGELTGTGEQVRVLTRREGAAFPAGVEVAHGDLARPDQLAAAFAGVDRLFLQTPPSGPGSAAAVAHACGVRRVVLLSSLVAQKADPLTNALAARHCAAEQAVRKSGMSWTILRPDTFAANALEWAPAIRAHGVVRAAYGLSQRCPIHERDVAAVAVAALREPSHDGATHWLTGPQTITLTGQVEAISGATGKPIRFEEMEPGEALAAMAARMPAQVAERLLAYAARSVGTPPQVTDTVSRALGRPALSFRQWADDHAAEFA